MSETIPAADYSTVRDGGAGLIDLSARGRILVSGSEAVTFLNGLITNDMKTLAPNTWMPAAFPNVQGRLLAAVRVIRREDGFLIDTEAATRETVLRLVERYTLAGDFRVTDLTSETAQLSVQGAKAKEIIAGLFGESLPDLTRSSAATINLEGESITVIRATHTGEDGFDLFANASQKEHLFESFADAGAHTVSPDTLETLRIEAGIPRYGIDMDETNVVTETNLDDAVSFTKGCYVGQEIIVRVKHRGHVAKKLTGLVFETEVNLERGAKILSTDDKEIGRVTSVAFSPRLNRTIAMGYVKYDYLEPGTSVSVASGQSDAAATVAELPLIRGSWFHAVAP